MTPIRKDQFAISVTINDTAAGEWSNRSGGEIDSEETLFHPGGMKAPISLGGRRTYGALTLQRPYDPVADAAIHKLILGGVGSGTVVCTSQALDADGNAYAGAILTYKGTLKTYVPPEYDSESNDAGLMQIDVTVESVT